MKKHTIVAGPSANPELPVLFNSHQKGDKKRITNKLRPVLAGSSANVLSAVGKHGGEGLLVGFVGAHDSSFVDVMLHEAAVGAGIKFWRLPVLEETNVAIVPLDEHGENSYLLTQSFPVLRHMVSAAEAEIQNLPLESEVYAVVTGLRPGQEFFANALFARASRGRRILNLNETICSEPSLPELLALADLLVINKHEFEKTKCSIGELHGFGPSVVIVTENELGGEFSICGHSRRFDAISFEGESRSNTGAGDWFLGTLVWWLQQSNLLVDHIFDLALLEQGVKLAARVAGKKITMPGGANGPCVSEL